VRFAHDAPNDLWQMDFMGHRPLETGRVHPLTILDDHSRFALSLTACPNQQQAGVVAQLTAIFQCYGLPQAILTDHGTPWGTGGQGRITTLAAWLLRLGIAVWHGRPYHPQTRGKVERFHGTIAAELFTDRLFPDLPGAQVAFARWRALYNPVGGRSTITSGPMRPSPTRFPRIAITPVCDPSQTRSPQ
jgi:transposase InsO family protein